MTKLNKAVTRLSEESMVRDCGRLKPLVITIYPGGTIGLRPSKTRREEFISAAACYETAIKMRVRGERAEKKASRKKGA
jgi:hypothetical protein